MKKIILILPVFYASYLINGDLDNYNEEELQNMKAIEKENRACVGIDFDTQSFSRYDGLGCDVAEFTFFN